MPLNQSRRLIRMTKGPLGPNEVVVTSFSGREAISRPFDFEIEFISTRLDLRPGAIIGKELTLELDRRDKDSQPLGAEMRARGVLAFLFRSARAPGEGKNIALYAPLFTKKTPLGFSQWVSTTSQSRVEIAARDPLHPARLAFSRDEFEVKGVLPDPGRLA